MSVCTFYGHRECPEEIKNVLKSTVEDFIVNRGVDVFYVGNQGMFDAMVRGVLREMEQKYPYIRYGVVLAYPPQGECETDTMLPEGIETVHPRYAIDWCNRWMLNRTDVVITYITHTWGGAYRYAEQARKRGLCVIPLGREQRE